MGPYEAPRWSESCLEGPRLLSALHRDAEPRRAVSFCRITKLEDVHRGLNVSVRAQCQSAPASAARNVGDAQAPSTGSRAAAAPAFNGKAGQLCHTYAHAPACPCVRGSGTGRQTERTPASMSLFPSAPANEQYLRCAHYKPFQEVLEGMGE